MSILSRIRDTAWRVVGFGLPEIDAPRVFSEVDALEIPANIEYNPRRPNKKTKPTQKAVDWKHIKRPGWEKQDFDLDEILKAAKTESFIRLSIDKHREHALRHGWIFVGRNKSTVSYIYKRMAELSEAMGSPVELQIRQAIKNFIKFSNFFLSWSRDRTRPYNGRFGKQKGRAKGLFSLGPNFMRYRRDPVNRILEWYQKVDPHDVEEVKDVVHGAFDRDDGYVFGTPYLLPVLDDTQTWRRFEELEEILVHKFAFPLYHHKIGEKDRDPEIFDDGTTEIGEAAAAISSKAAEGHLITSHRHTIEVIGAKQHALDIEPLVRYWESRVLTGLVLSTLDIGRGDTATRNTAETLSKSLADRCAEYQREFALIFNFYILDELLLEGGYELTPENRVFIRFPDIDREARRAEETHLVFLYQSNAITHDEMRMGMHKQPFLDGDWQKTAWEQITKPSAIIAAADELYMQSKPGEASAMVANKAKPENQHGVKPTKTAVKKDTLKDDIIQILDSQTDDTDARILNLLTVPIVAAMQKGVEKFNTEQGTSATLNPEASLRFLKDQVLPQIQTCIGQPHALKDKASVLRLFTGIFEETGRNYAYAYAAKDTVGSTHIIWEPAEDACPSCRALDTISIDGCRFTDLLPPHIECVKGFKHIEIPVDGEAGNSVRSSQAGV